MKGSWTHQGPGDSGTLRGAGNEPKGILERKPPVGLVIGVMPSFPAEHQQAKPCIELDAHCFRLKSIKQRLLKMSFGLPKPMLRTNYKGGRANHSGWDCSFLTFTYPDCYCGSVEIAPNEAWNHQEP